MKFRIHIEKCIGPWFSLGLHIDLRNLYFDVHFFWWIVSIGNLYWMDEQWGDRRIDSRTFEAVARVTGTVVCPECENIFDIDIPGCMMEHGKDGDK